MTARAIGGHAGAEFSRHSMIAVFIAADALAGHAKFLRQAHSLMAAGAYGSAERRPRITVRFDGVNAMAIRADRRLRNTPRGGLAVNALDELAHHLRVAAGARLRNVCFEGGK